MTNYAAIDPPGSLPREIFSRQHVMRERFHLHTTEYPVVSMLEDTYDLAAGVVCSGAHQPLGYG